MVMFFAARRPVGDPRKAGPRTGIIRAAHASPVAVFRTNHGHRCFYDALAVNESAVKAMGDDKLKLIT